MHFSMHYRKRHKFKGWNMWEFGSSYWNYGVWDFCFKRIKIVPQRSIHILRFFIWKPILIEDFIEPIFVFPLTDHLISHFTQYKEQVKRYCMTHSLRMYSYSSHPNIPLPLGSLLEINRRLKSLKFVEQAVVVWPTTRIRWSLANLKQAC